MGISDFAESDKGARSMMHVQYRSRPRCSHGYSRRQPLFDSGWLNGIVVCLLLFHTKTAFSQIDANAANGVRRAARERIRELLEKGKSGKAKVNAFGRMTSVTLKEASDDALTVFLDGDFLDIEWDTVNDHELANILLDLSGDSMTPEDRVRAGILQRLSGNFQDGQNLIARAIQENPDEADALTAMKTSVFGKENPVTFVTKPEPDKSEKQSARHGPGDAKYFIGRPRLFMRGESLPGTDIDTVQSFIEKSKRGKRAKFFKMMQETNPNSPATLAALYLIKGDTNAADRAIAILQKPGGENSWYYCSRWLVPYAVAYDWLHDYPGFTEEKKAGARKVLSAAQKAMMEYMTTPLWGSNYSYIPLGGAVCATVALYGEEPSVRKDLKTLERYMETAIPPILDEFNGGWPEGWSYYLEASIWLGTSLEAYRSFSGRDLMRVKVNGDYPYHKFYRGILMGFRPDHTWVRWGDIVSGAKSTTWGHVSYDLQPAVRAFKDPEIVWLLEQTMQRYNKFYRAFDPDLALFGLLFAVNDYPVPGKKPENTSILMGNNSLGQVIMRSGWDPDDTIVTFKCGDVLGRAHADYDSGAFTIFCKKALLLDSGMYGKIGSPYYVNYKKQGIAHNVILAGEPGVSGDEGTQKVPRTHLQHDINDILNPGKAEAGEILAFDDTGEYVYVAGNVSAAYSKGIRKWTRELVFIRPDILVVCDRVESDPSTEKRFLMHSHTQPEVDGNRIRIENGGFLEAVSLLPDNAKIRIIGGPGKEFWYHGKNWTNGGKVDEYSGAWRAEIYQEPGRASTVFLTVFRFGPRKIPVQATASPSGLGAVVNGKRIQFSQVGHITVK